ncbi:MAG TPA: MauE/DoxX family redox-associated membrane protein [Candidatus Limnocylindria bacterium]|nr:MauE/DoxX family redox-associated membrane protein [Candidatus Limnocylindria bacterium]
MSGAEASGSRNAATWGRWLLRLVVGGAFVFAGSMKIADPAKFVLDVENYRLVPHVFLNLVAILLPWIEVVTGLFVLAGVWLRAAALVITCLTLIFALIISSALARGLNIECGCFGTVGGKHIGLVNLGIDTTLFCLAALLVLLTPPVPPERHAREIQAIGPSTSP